MLQSVGNKIMLLVVQILLARIVGPNEFGLLALTSIFVLLAGLITDGGFSDAIIQAKSVSRIDISTVFFINLMVASAMVAVLMIAAPTISSFFGEPRLCLILRVISLILVISALGKIHSSLLVRNLEFKRLFWISTPAIIVSSIVGLTMAVSGFGVWAIVAQQLCTGICSSVLYWVTSPFDRHPTLAFSWESARRLAGFGGSMLGAGLMYQGFAQLYGLVIGKFYLPADLAFYNRAQSFQRTPVATLQTIIGRVLFPVFSGIQDDDQRVTRSLRKGMPMLAFVIIPIMVLLISIARPLVLFLLSDEWLPTAQYLTWLPIVGIVYSLSAINVTVWKAKGRSKMFFVATVAKQVLALGILIGTVRFGVYWIVVGQVVHAIIAHVINMFLTGRISGYSVRMQVFDTMPYLAVAAFAGSVSYCIFELAISLPTLIQLILQTILFSSLYLFACRLFQLEAINTVFNRLKQEYNKRIGQGRHETEERHKNQMRISK